MLIPREDFLELITNDTKIAKQFIGIITKNIVEKGRATIFGSGTNPINFIAVKDVVEAIDKIALNENYYNKINILLYYYINKYKYIYY